MNWSIALWPWLLVGILGLIGIFGGWWLWWRLPKRQVDHLRLTIRDAKARADVEDSFRKTIGQLLGGAAVLLGAGLAYLQFQQQQRSAHDLFISNQVSRGFELLGSDKLVLRVAGIYALGNGMNTAEYHGLVLETLSAFVREHARAERGGGPPATDPETVLSNAQSIGPLATDIQAALTVIGRRATGWSDRVDLGGAHIPLAFLPRANLREAYLSDTDLRIGMIIDADLVRAFLIKADLASATLMGADLTGAQLREASLVFARLGGANLTNASLELTTLSYADLRGAKGLTQTQLNEACGTDVRLDPPLTIKPCSPDPPDRSVAPR